MLDIWFIHFLSFMSMENIVTCWKLDWDFIYKTYFIYFTLNIYFVNPNVPPEIPGCLTPSLVPSHQWALAAVAGSRTHCLCNPEGWRQQLNGICPTKLPAAFSTILLNTPVQSCILLGTVWIDSGDFGMTQPLEMRLQWKSLRQEYTHSDSHREMSSHPQSYRCPTVPYTCLQELSHRKPSSFLCPDSLALIAGQNSLMSSTQPAGNALGSSLFCIQTVSGASKLHNSWQRFKLLQASLLKCLNTHPPPCIACGLDVHCL